MVDITPLIQADRRIIQGYGPGLFRVSGETYHSAIIVFPDRVLVWDFSGSPDDLKPEDFRTFFESADGTEVVVFGSGSSGCFIKQALRQAFTERGMAIEAMDTGAACRTYNVLMAEGRQVAALLLPY